MGDLDNYQFEPKNKANNNSRVFQRNNVVEPCSTDSNEGTRKRHHLTTYRDDEGRWLVKADEEERSRGKGFMKRLKNRWDIQYPNKRNISKQNLRDNAIRFKKEFNIIRGRSQVTGNINNIKKTSNFEWTNEMKIALLEIEESERNKGRGFMKRMEETWNCKYEDKPMIAQGLRDNAARFRKDSALMNLMEVRDRRNIELDEVVGQEREHDNDRLDEREDNEVDIHFHVGITNSRIMDSNSRNDDIEETENEREEENEERNDLELKFIENLNNIKLTTNRSIEPRERLLKVKKTIKIKYFDIANKVIQNYLGGTNDFCKIIDAVYAMAKAIQQMIGLKFNEKKKKKKDEGDENRRIRKLKKQVKESRQMLGWLTNEIYRRRMMRKGTKKEKEILAMLRHKTRNQLISNNEVLKEKELWLEELRYKKLKLEKTRTRDAKIKNNRMFNEDEAMFYRKIDSNMDKKGKVPGINKFVEFWAGIWEDETATPDRKWMRTVGEKIRSKVSSVEEFEIDEKMLGDNIKRKKNWSSPGIDGIPNIWWKKLKGTWKPLVKSFKKWIDQPESIPDWVTHGRTVLLPKSEVLDDEKNYRPITCLNTAYKIFTGILGKYLKEHAERNNIWDKSQLGACSGVLGTVDQLIVDNTIMEEVRERKRNVAVAFYDYQKAYDMVKHDWMLRVYGWMQVPDKMLNVIRELMRGWKTRLEVVDKSETIVSRWINIMKGFLQGDSFSPVGFCITEVPIGMLLQETDGYMMGPPGERNLKRTHSLFIDDLKVYQQNHKKLEIANEMIVKASSDTGACYGVKKCAEIVFMCGKMEKGDGLKVLEERMRALDPKQNEVYKFLGCEQADKIDVDKVMERVKIEMEKRLEQLVKMNLNDRNLIKAINCRVVPVAGYIMNVCNLRKGEIEELDKLVKKVLRKEGFHGKQSSDERLYGKRDDGGRGVKCFKEVYDETKVRVACYMAASSNEWIQASWKNEFLKEQTSLRKEAESVMQKFDIQVEFKIGSIVIENEERTNWKECWKKLKEMIKEGQRKAKFEALKEKKMQSEIPSKFDREDCQWLKCNTEPRKTASIFALQEQMIETKAWKKMRGLVDDDKCRLCGEFRETVQHLLAGCKMLAGTEYLRRHDNALKVLAVKWAIDNGLLPEGTKWYKEKWEKGKVIEGNGKKLYWDWEHRMRVSCVARRPDLTIEDSEKKIIMIIDMACPNEANKEEKRLEKIRKYQQLCFELRERRVGFKVKVVPAVIGCLGGGMKMLKRDVNELFENETDMNQTIREMQKTVLWESESIMRKVLSGLLLN